MVHKPIKVRLVPRDPPVVESKNFPTSKNWFFHFLENPLKLKKECKPIPLKVPLNLEEASDEERAAYLNSTPTLHVESKIEEKRVSIAKKASVEDVDLFIETDDFIDPADTKAVKKLKKKTYVPVEFEEEDSDKANDLEPPPPEEIVSQATVSKRRDSFDDFFSEEKRESYQREYEKIATKTKTTTPQQTIGKLSTILEGSDEEKKREIIFKFKMLKQTYAKDNVQVPSMEMSLSEMERTYKEFVTTKASMQKLKSHQTWLKWGLVGLETALVSKGGVSSARGMTAAHMKEIDSYNELLLELGEYSLMPDTKEWPVYAKLPFILAYNSSAFLAMNWASGGGSTDAPPPPEESVSMQAPSDDLFD